MGRFSVERVGGSLRAWLLLGLLVPCIALADFTGHVVKVADGDTITVLVQYKQIKVRLESIRAHAVPRR